MTGQPVISPKAGIQTDFVPGEHAAWIPAFAGMPSQEAAE